MKPFYKSKTLWANLITLAISGLTMASESADPKVVAYITGLVIPLLNVGLRFVTKEPVTTKRPNTYKRSPR